MKKSLCKKIRKYTNRLPEMKYQAVRYVPVPDSSVIAGHTSLKPFKVKVRVNHYRRAKKRVARYGFPLGVYMYVAELKHKGVI